MSQGSGDRRMESFEIEAAPDASTSPGASRDDNGPGRRTPSTWWDSLNPFRLLSGDAGERAKLLEEEFQKLLSDTRGEDFSDLEMLQFIQTGFHELNGQPAVLIIAKHLPISVIQPDRLYRFVMLKIESLARKDFSVVYIHTGSSYWTNSPGIRWLWNTYERAPPWLQANLKCLYILHPDLQLHASMWVVCRWMSGNLWSKVRFLVRLEFLWDHFAKDMLHLPTFVVEHDQELEEHPLMDYGIITTKEWSPPGGPDLARYQ